MTLLIYGHTWGVWGLGIVGKSAISFLSAHGARIEVMDKKYPTPAQREFLEKHGATFVHENNAASFFSHNEYIVPSPGIALHKFSYQGTWVPELDLMEHFFHKPIIAITGSVGKTSVTTLISALLRSYGKRVVSAGNIGNPMLDLIDLQEHYDYAILEVSSFQLSHTKFFAPDLAIWTNFYPNHLDWHDTLEHYFYAKSRIIRHQNSQQSALVAQDIIAELKTLFNPSSNLYTFSSNHRHGDYRMVDNCFMYQNIPLIKNISLPDNTFIENWLICLAALHQLGYPLETCLMQSIAYKSQPHRLEYITTINQCSFYNDSKSTIAQATLAAVRKFNKKRIALFLGGLSKGINRASLLQALTKEPIVALYCFGHEAELLQSYAKIEGLYAQAFSTLDNAFAACMQQISPNTIILFSPGGSSFDLFNDYQERGSYFKKLVLTYQEKIPAQGM